MNMLIPITIKATIDAPIIKHTNSPEMQRSGWQAILNNFKKYVEGGA